MVEQLLLVKRPRSHHLAEHPEVRAHSPSAHVRAFRHVLHVAGTGALARGRL